MILFYLTPFLRSPPFYLPYVYQILQRQRLEVFVKLDLANAFNIPIHSASRYVTTFFYDKTYYRFTKMPFSLS